MFSTGIFPDKLKLAKVLPFYKKGEKALLKNYRPISILPSISKFFEKVILIKFINISHITTCSIQVNMVLGQGIPLNKQF